MSRVASLGTVVLAGPDPDVSRSALRDASIVWVRLGQRLDKDFMNQAPRLKVIVTATTGLNHIDLAEAEKRGIRVLSLQGEVTFLKSIRATAEHTMALMLALLRHIPQAAAHVREGNWNRDAFKGHEINEKTVGVIGYGRLGRIVSSYLTAFGARVITTDPNCSQADLAPGVAWMSLEQLLAESDVVTLHVSYSETNNRMLGYKEFAHMKPGAWFVNTARGELVDEDALLAALITKRLAGAALDVLSDEHSGLLKRPLFDYARRNSNLILTPHIGGCTFESMEKTEAFLASKLCESVLAEAALPADVTA